MVCPLRRVQRVAWKTVPGYVQFAARLTGEFASVGTTVLFAENAKVSLSESWLASTRVIGRLLKDLEKGVSSELMRNDFESGDATVQWKVVRPPSELG